MPNVPRRKGLAAAVASVLGCGGLLAMPAHAVNLADDGIGEALIYQYYTNQPAPVAGNWQTFFHVVNTSGDTVAVKVNYREAENSRDVLDFVLVLSPWDVWTGFTTNDSSGDPVLRTVDNSCTSPSFIPVSGGINPDLKELRFRSTGYTGARADSGGTTLDRTREGYVEMINLGHAVPGSVVDAAARHNQLTGVPSSCTTVDNAFRPENLTTTAIDFTEPLNVLKGNGYLINTTLGQGGGFDPVVLANFYNPGFQFGLQGAAVGIDGTSEFDFRQTSGASANGITILGSQSLVSNVDSFGGLPDLSFASPAISMVRDDTPFVGPRTIIDQWTDGEDAVSAVLMRNKIHNEWAARLSDNAFNNTTEWVVTFPTKRFYVDSAFERVPEPPPEDNALAPFTNLFQDNGESCHRADAWIFDREERTVDNQSPPLDPVLLDFCYETNVLSFRGEVVDPILNSAVPVRQVDFAGNTLAESIRTVDLPQPIQLAGTFFGYLQLQFDGETGNPNANVGFDGGPVEDNLGLGSDLLANQVYDDEPAAVQAAQLAWDAWCVQFIDPGPPLTYTFSGSADGSNPPLPNDPEAQFGLAGGPVPGAFLPSTLVQEGMTNVPFLAELNQDLIGLDPEADAPQCVNLTTPQLGESIPPTYLFNFTDGWATYAGYPTVGWMISFRTLANDPSQNYSTILQHGYSRNIQILRDDGDGDLEDSLVPANYDFGAGQWSSADLNNG